MIWRSKRADFQPPVSLATAAAPGQILLISQLRAVPDDVAIHDRSQGVALAAGVVIFELLIRLEAAGAPGQPEVIDQEWWPANPRWFESFAMCCFRAIFIAI